MTGCEDLLGKVVKSLLFCAVVLKHFSPNSYMLKSSFSLSNLTRPRPEGMVWLLHCHVTVTLCNITQSWTKIQ